ncbi:MAG: DNA-processing protein DprA [Mariprofundaceae bacterium]|nr:DNA-processing protein DprA [Mariprofundaceae bacterium]
MTPSAPAMAALRLSLVRGVGVYIARQLLEALGSYESVWHSSDSQWAQIEGIGPKLLSALKGSDMTQAEHIAKQCQQASIQLLCSEDADYPNILNSNDDAPLLLFVRGDARALSHPQPLAIVGARKSSHESKMIAKRWSQYFSEHHILVISGMAYGIDAAAHSGALGGATPTIAVLGCGLLRLQARQEQQVAAIIEHGGCVVSEFLPEQAARPENFPQRNRIIAGLAQATLVIEADIRSGSIITANHAASYGREVLATPGSVLNNGHAGCHQLIRDGANLIDSPEQLLQLLNWQLDIASENTPFVSDNEAEMAVFHALQHDILHLDALSEACSLTVPALSPILLDLELRGVIERLAGSRYTLGGL